MSPPLRFGEHTATVERPCRFGLVISGLSGSPPADWLHEVLLAPEHREAFFQLVDHEGLVVVKAGVCEHPTYRFVRGRSSRGRLSQGEYFHHDGCSGPTKPRVVEIRFPPQEIGRRIATSIAPFPATVRAMWAELPRNVAEEPQLQLWAERVDANNLGREEWDQLQGLITRAVRRALDAPAARAYFRGVDARAGAYNLPWEWGESRFIANHNAILTMQHRRAYLDDGGDGRPNGNLVKRWPAEEL